MLIIAAAIIKYNYDISIIAYNSLASFDSFITSDCPDLSEETIFFPYPFMLRNGKLLFVLLPEKFSERKLTRF